VVVTVNTRISSLQTSNAGHNLRTGRARALRATVRVRDGLEAKQGA
jgi:hypothetical protein